MSSSPSILSKMKSQPVLREVPSDTTLSIPSSSDGNLDTGIDAAKLEAANRYVRWNLLFLLLIFTFLLFPIWMPFVPYVNKVTNVVIVIIIGLFQIIWLIATICAIRRTLAINYRNKLKTTKTQDIESADATSDSDPTIRHIVAMTLYKEPMSVLETTLNSLVQQKDAKSRLSVIIGMECRTPDKEAKRDEVYAKYESRFLRLIVTFHPSGVPGEISGKCSNMNYACRQGLQILREDVEYNYDNYEHIFTNCDCDAVFDPEYMLELESEYCKLEPADRHSSIWQSIIVYKRDSMPFFVDITGVLRTFFFMGILIPWNINPMPHYSLSVKVLEEGAFTHPAYQMEDIIALIRYTIMTKREIRIRPLNLISINGPTSGANYADEIREWTLQVRRWTIGAGEVFHYFIVKTYRMPSLCLSISWATRFFTYYGLVLCASAIFSVASPVIVQLINMAAPEHDRLFISDSLFSTICFIFLGTQYAFFLIVTVLVRWNLPVPGDSDKKYNEGLLGISRGILHWILMLPAIFAYSLVELYSFFELAFRGKNVCKHEAASKSNLVLITGAGDS
ncbi:Ff.00g078360.m01.CDS01 [Fusarium sp. VM40]|nr:Ff.00g078360.m01.CDS01 [Fusarium sp. VM40]